MDLGINWYKYEQYNSVWCKVVTYDDKHKSLKTDLEMIKDLIETISMYHTPESWCNHFQLKEDKWKLSISEHHLITHEIIEACWFYQNDEIQEAKQERNEYLSWFGFDGGIEALKNASKDKQQEAHKLLEKWHKTSLINEKDELRDIVFNKHYELQDKFLNQLFTDDVRFFTNKTIEETKVCLYQDKRISPAIIGMDNEKMAMLWFNY